MVGEGHMRVLDVGAGRGGFAAMLRDAATKSSASIERLSSSLIFRPGSALGCMSWGRSSPCRFSLSFRRRHCRTDAAPLRTRTRADRDRSGLKPGGYLAIAYNTRDDTVPWVRRLIALMREADPNSMRGDYGADSVEKIAESPYFGLLERRNFRNWTPITRDGLIAMVERRPAVARLDPAVRAELVREVGASMRSTRGQPDPLMLLFQTSCWRAEVDHSN